MVLALFFSCLAAEAPAHQDIVLHIAALDERIAAAPDAVLHARRADLFRQHRDWERALADYAAAARLAPDDPAVPVGRARVYLDSGAPRRALETLAPLLAVTPEHGSARLLEARALAALGESNAASVAFARAISRLPQPLPEHDLEHADALASATPPRLPDAIGVLAEGIARLGGLVSLHGRALDFERRAGLLQPALERIRGLRSRQGIDLPAWRLAEAEILASLGRDGEAREACFASLTRLRALPAARRATPALREMEARTLATLSALDAAATTGLRSGGEPSAEP